MQVMMRDSPRHLHDSEYTAYGQFILQTLVTLYALPESISDF